MVARFWGTTILSKSMQMSKSMRSNACMHSLIMSGGKRYVKRFFVLIPWPPWCDNGGINYRIAAARIFLMYPIKLSPHGWLINFLWYYLLWEFENCCSVLITYMSFKVYFGCNNIDWRGQLCMECSPLYCYFIRSVENLPCVAHFYWFFEKWLF